MTRSRFLATVPVVTGLLLAAGCVDDDPDATPTTRTGTAPRTDATVATTTPRDDTVPRPDGSLPTGPFGSSRLAFFGDCPALLQYLQTEAGERVTAWGLGGGYWYGPDMAVAEEARDAAGAPAATMPATGELEPGVDYSTTNTQEEGVDEGDVVETDGRYVYTVVNDGLRIVEVDTADVVDRTELPAGDHQLLLLDDRLVVVTQGWNTGEDTIVSVFDVSDPTEPLLLRRTHLEGRLVASRAADGTVRLVLSTSLQQRLPFVQPQMFGLDEERALDENRRIIAESEVQDWLPRWFDEAVDSGAFGEM